MTAHAPRRAPTSARVATTPRAAARVRDRWFAAGALVAASALVVLLAGCEQPGGGGGFVEAGSDGAASDGSLDARPGDGGCTSDEQCQNALFCDGVERCVMGACVAGADPCDDRRTCTMDRCDEERRECVREADHRACTDGNDCNGVERCDPMAVGASATTGCTPVRPDNVLDCDDANNCTIDSCDPAAGCVHAPRDLDGDGHIDRMCPVDGASGSLFGTDCNDGDPDVYPGAPELCADNRDNNCDGRIDVQDTAMCRPPNGTCATAQRLAAAGLYWGSTVGLASALTPSCATGTAGEAYFTFTLAEPRDVTLSTTATGTSAVLALRSSCAADAAELRCARATSSGTPQLRARSLPAGSYIVVVETGGSGAAFRLSYRTDPPTPMAPEDVCPASSTAVAVELNDGMPHVVAFAPLEDDYLLSCNSGGGRRDAVFKLTLTQPADVILRATAPTSPANTTWFSVRPGPCANGATELRCSAGNSSAPLLFTRRAMPAGEYFVLLENSGDRDVTVQATLTSPPAPRPTIDLCPADDTAPTVELNDGMPHRAAFAMLEDDYALSCNASGMRRDAVFRLTLTQPADVVVRAVPVALTPVSTTYLSLRGTPCNTNAAERRCLTGSTAAPPTIALRTLPAGTYYVHVENSADQDVDVTAMLTSPPAPRPPEDLCPATTSAAAMVPDLSDGMIRNARLATFEDDYNLSCAGTGRRDAVYRLVLRERSDVTVRAIAATGTVYLLLRSGECATSAGDVRCLAAAGTTGAVLSRRALDPGTYWVHVENSADADIGVNATVTPALPTPRYELENEPSGVGYLDVCAMPGTVRLVPSVDDRTDALPASAVPFPVRVYGLAVPPPFSVSSNGWLSFLPTTNASYSSRIGEPGDPSMLVAAYWTDIATRAGGVCVNTVGTAPNRTLVVQWDDAYDLGLSESHLDFEILVREATPGQNNVVDIAYRRIDGVAMSSRMPSAGIENEDASLSTAVPGNPTAPRVVRLRPVLPP